MVIFVFALGIIMAAAGAAALIASMDLLPTEVGMLYAISGVIALSASAIVVSLGAVVQRLGTATSAAVPEAPALIAEPDAAPMIVAPTEPEAPVPVAEEAINENRAGHLPTLSEFESAIAHPEAPPAMVGRYSAGGANYVIYSDGTIEAEIGDGVYRFGSKDELTSYLKGRRA